LAEDGLWLLVYPAGAVTLVRAHVEALAWVHEHVLGGVQVDLERAVGSIGAVAFVAGDALAWGSYLARHKIPQFWAFHAVHHSQRDLNALTESHVLVTPQSHRVHHSIEDRHRDRNFAMTLSVWDRLFGTSYRAADEYPEAGVSDPGFPTRLGHGPAGLPRTVAAQFVHPFRTFVRPPLSAVPE